MRIFRFADHLVPQFLTLALLAAMALSRAGAAPSPAPVLAVVEKKIITAHDLDFWIFEYRLFRPEAQQIADEQLRRVLLPDAVDDALLYGWADLQLKNVPVEAVETRLKAAYIRYDKLAGGGDRLNDLLRDAKIDGEDFRAWAKEQARHSFVIREAVSAYANFGGAEPSDAKIENATRLKIAQILIKPTADNPLADGQALERVLRIRRDIEAGLPFPEAARLYSEDEYTAESSGEIGWFTREELAPELWKAAVATKRAETSAPVRTKAGYHLLVVLDFETPDQTLYYERLRNAEDMRLRKLRRESDIRLQPGYELSKLPDEPAQERGFWDEIEGRVGKSTLPAPGATPAARPAPRATAPGPTTAPAQTSAHPSAVLHQRK
ncbi:hypothetical protein BH09SUM1_BH09SUM1_00340 [soil metagenome]